MRRLVVLGLFVGASLMVAPTVASAAWFCLAHNTPGTAGHPDWAAARQSTKSAAQDRAVSGCNLSHQNRSYGTGRCRTNCIEVGADTNTTAWACSVEPRLFLPPPNSFSCK